MRFIVFTQKLKPKAGEFSSGLRRRGRRFSASDDDGLFQGWTGHYTIGLLIFRGLCAVAIGGLVRVKPAGAARAVLLAARASKAVW
jgi:hypothetical protein